MTITSSYVPSVFDGSGSVGPFSVPFRILDKSHITVEKIVGSTVSVLSEGAGSSQYSISLTSGGLLGCQITLGTALAVSERLVVSRSTPVTQAEKISNLARFNAEIHENAFDKATMIIQEAKYEGSNAVKFPTSDTEGLVQTLPVDSARASKVMGFDALGQPKVSTLDIDTLDDFETALTEAETAATTATSAASSASAAAASAAASAALVPLNNFSATTDPTVNDDSGDGYSVGSEWWNTSTGDRFGCTDATAGAAVWISLSTDLSALKSGAYETVENIRLIPQQSKSADYTLVLTDVGKHIYHPSADTTPRTFTIPANGTVAFPIGTAISFVNDSGAGDVTIAITTDDLVLSGTGATGSRTLAANGQATALKVTSTRWIISGVGLT